MLKILKYIFVDIPALVLIAFLIVFTSVAVAALPLRCAFELGTGLSQGMLKILKSRMDKEVNNDDQ